MTETGLHLGQVAQPSVRTGPGSRDVEAVAVAFVVTVPARASGPQSNVRARQAVTLGRWLLSQRYHVSFFVFSAWDVVEVVETRAGRWLDGWGHFATGARIVF